MALQLLHPIAGLAATVQAPYVGGRLNAALPTSSLFRINATPGAKYLIETDPRFTNGRAFLSSNYLVGGDQRSVSRSAVSQGAITLTDDKAQQSLTGQSATATLASLNTKVTTDSATAGTIQRAWDGQNLIQQTQANVAITAAFGSRAAKAVGDIATKQQSDLLAQAGEARNVGDTTKADQLQGEADKWAEGGAYRIAAHVAVGALTTGSLQGAVGAGASAAAAPQINAAMQSLDAPAGVKTVVGAALAAAIGSAASGGSAVGAATAVNGDLNNRQLHPNERLVISKLAKDKAEQSCKGDSQCLASAGTYWTDALERVAKGDVDDKASAENAAYVSALLTASKNPSSEGANGKLFAYLDSLKEAQTMLAAYTGQPIVVNGKVEVSNGTAQTYFGATSAQRADDWSNRILGEVPSPIAAGAPARDEQRLERFGAINGAVKPNYTVEELLLGGAVQNRVAGIAARVWSDLEVALAGKAVSSAGGNISARQLTEMGMQATLTATERDLLRQAADQSSTSVQGKVSEHVTDSYFARNGYKQIEGKCGSDNCFDSVFVRGDKVYVVETKPLQSNGAIKLSGPNPSTTLETQMSDAWIDNAVSRLGLETSASAKSTADIIKAAKDSGNLVKLVSGANQDGLVIVKLK